MSTSTLSPPFELVVVSYHSRSQLEGMLAGLPADLPVALVDNARGADGLEELAGARQRCRYVDSGGGAGFARAANLGVATSSYDYVVLVNPDSRPTLEALRTLVADVASDDRCASSSALNVGPDGSSELGAAGWEPSWGRAVAHAVALHKVLPRSGLFARPAVGESITVDWVTGACMALPRRLFLELGGFDGRYYVYSEDVAFGRVVRERGLHQRLRTDVPVPHASGGSGAPSLEMMRLRGASFARYAQNTRGGASARLITGTVGGGYLVRAALMRATGRRARAREHWAYVKGAFTGRASVGGQEVTDRD